MPTKRYLIENTDGSVSVLSVFGKKRDEHGRLTQELTAGEEIAKWTPERRSKIVSVTEITTQPIPDRYFRNAWAKEGEGLAVDMAKAREIQMTKIRHARDAKLRALDIRQLAGEDVQDEKAVLRDLPQTFKLDGATTPEELKVLWPAELADA